MVHGIAWAWVNGFGCDLFESDILQYLLGQVIHLVSFQVGAD
jgi:hypothetical protein